MRRQLLVLIAFSVVACGGGSKTPGAVTSSRYVLQAVTGYYTDGSNRDGVAVLATLRDPDGKGPPSPWTLSLTNSQGDTGATGTYDAPNAGSFVLWLFPDVPYSTSASYTLTLSGPEGTAEVALQDQYGHAPGVPTPALSADGSTLSWASDAYATSFRCFVTSQGDLQLQADGNAPTCDVSALGDGSYVAAVESLTADLVALAGDPRQTPPLPAFVDVLEGKLGFVKGGTTAYTLAAAGGPITINNPSFDGLSLWLSLQDSSGAAPTTDWTLSVTGPGISSSNPLQFAYPAGSPQALLWNDDLAVQRGQYSVVATNGSLQLSTSFTVGYYQNITIPWDPAGSGKPGGGATLSWSLLPDAKSYYASIYDHGTGDFFAGHWTTGNSVDFTPQEAPSGHTYDGYVAACDDDMTQLERPLSVRVAENAYWPATIQVP